MGILWNILHHSYIWVVIENESEALELIVSKGQLPQ